MKSLFLFDCFGVLLSPIAYRWLSKHYAKEIVMDKLVYFFKGVEEGERPFLDMIDMISDELNMPSKTIVDEWINMVEINQVLWDEILKLRKIGKTALLSNAGDFLIEEIFKRKGIDPYKYFDKVFISAYYHIVKPDLRFYQMAIGSFDEKFDHITMVDDRPINLAHLHEIGIDAILMNDNESVIKKLENY